MSVVDAWTRVSKSVAYVIAADEIKKDIEGYDPAHSNQFHQASAKMADKMYDKAVKRRSERKVILLAGGAASGKSEYVATYLTSTRAIILDGTLPTTRGAEIKIEKAIKQQKKIELHLVLPESLIVAFGVFLNRQRKYDISHFYRTHSSSRQTAYEIVQCHEDIKVRVISSKYVEFREGGTMEFKYHKFVSRQMLLEFLCGIQYTEQQIRNEILDYVTNSSTGIHNE